MKILDQQFARDKYAGDEFNIYRLVQVVWIADTWNIPPDVKEIFDYDIKFPPNGKAIKLENLEDFRSRWNKEEFAFQQHVEKILSVR